MSRNLAHTSFTNVALVATKQKSCRNYRFVALLEVRTKLNNFAVATVLVILLEEPTTKVAKKKNKQTNILL